MTNVTHTSRVLLVWLCALMSCAPDTTHPPRMKAIAPASFPSHDKGRASSPSETSKRSIVHRLIERLRPENMMPSSQRNPALKCLKTGEAPVVNPFSDLPPSIRSMHRRASLNVGNRRRFEMRDSLVFLAERTFQYDLTLPPKPQLEFFYSLDPCRFGSAPVEMNVAITREGRTLFEHQLTLLPEKNRISMKPWSEINLPLPYLGPETSRLTVTFKPSQAGQKPAFLWAQPVISGLVPPAGGASDANVLFIVVDALRSDTVGPARVYEELAPAINALFHKGTSFREAFSVSNQTRHSTLGMLTGQPPTIGGFYSGSWVISKALRSGFYARKPPLLPQILGDAGYFVSTISHNRFQFESHPFGLDHGFDHVYDDRNKIDETEGLVDRAIEHLERHKDDRFFLLLNLVSPHLPYRPPQEHQVRVDALYKDQVTDPILRRYLAEISYADAQLKRVFDALNRLSLDDDTLVILTADHGEVFGAAHRCWSKRYRQSCHYNHGMTLFNEEIHVPLAFIWPGKVRANQVINTPTSHLNLAPTILDLLGLPEEPKHVGFSMRDALDGKPLRESSIYVESRTGTALIEKGMKFHTHSSKDDTRTLARTGQKAKPQSVLPRHQLYDLRIDPTETKNLVLQDPSVVPEWNRKIDAARALLASRFGNVENIKASSGPSAVNKLKLQSDGRDLHMSGVITAKTGLLSCIQTQGESRCTPLDKQRLKVSIRSGPHVSDVAFTSTPRDSPLELDLSVDGVPLAVDSIRLGPYGLRLLRTGQVLDRPQHLRLLTGRHGPKLRSKDEVALYMWRNPAVSQGIAPQPGVSALPPILGPDELDSRTGNEDLSPELEGVLKDLGYTQ